MKIIPLAEALTLLAQAHDIAIQQDVLQAKTFFFTPEDDVFLTVMAETDYADFELHFDKATNSRVKIKGDLMLLTEANAEADNYTVALQLMIPLQLETAVSDTNDG
jgi:hypothetical protein